MDERWVSSIKKLNEKREKVYSLGGDKKIDIQHGKGKLTARERLEFLFDDNSFVEIGSMMESTSTDFGMDVKRSLGDGVITGYGLIHGRRVFASSQDFTTSGGSLGLTHAKKICEIMELALKARSIYIAINDSGGARIEEGIDSLHGYAKIFKANSDMSGVVPQISVIMGPCAGGACYSPALTDFIFMTRETSMMFITGPAVVKTVTGEDISSKELGGASVHSEQSGVCDLVFDDDISCLNGVRRLVGFLPDSVDTKPTKIKTSPSDNSDALTSIVPSDPKKSYDVNEVIDTFVDYGTFMELKPDYAKNIVVGFARLDGDTIGIVANQSNYLAGSLEINASDKAARFIRLCDCFNIPIVTLVDVPAFLPGPNQEHAGIIRHGAKLLFAYSESTVPKISLITRKAYGGAYIAMNSKGLGADIVYAWPIAEIAVMGASGAVAIIGGKVTKNDKNELENLEESYNEKFMNPYVASSRGYVDEVISPDETRQKISSALMVLKNKKVDLANRKHGNIPL